LNFDNPNFHHFLSTDLNSSDILAIFREWTNQPAANDGDDSTSLRVRDQIQQIKANLTSKLPTDNYTTLS
jgi:hypothetical protein